MVRVWASVVAVLVLAGAARAAADDDDATESTTGPAVTRAAASAAAFTPFAQAASLEGRRAVVAGLGGYDSSRKTGSFEAATEVRLWGPIAVHAGAIYTDAGRSLKPSFGARVQGLREGRHGLDGALGVFYKPEGLTEPEGEIEGVVALGRHVGGSYVVANLLYGQDPEGNERDGEVRLAGLRPVGSRFVLGVDSRLRFDLGSNAMKLAAHHEPTLDGAAGPIATALLGPVALSAQAGPSVLRLQSVTTFGAYVLAGVGTAF
jgi:hypothetical protein